jgi:DNA-binding PadR family transcriptional regulator
MTRSDDGIERFLPLPRTSLHILLALSEGAVHGYAIKQHAEELTGGTVSPGPGTLYDAIARLEEQGLVEESPEPRHEPAHAQRRYYRLTRRGRRVLNAEVGRLAGIVDYAASRGIGPRRVRREPGTA